MENEVQNTPSADVSAEPMTIDAAASLMSQWPDDEPDHTVQTEQPTETVATEETVEEPAGEQTEEVVETEQQPEDTSYDWEKVPGTAKFRLRDGTEVTAADLKRDFDELRQARQLRQEIETHRSQFLQEQSRFAQEAQKFAQIAPQAIAAIQASMPEVPPYPSREMASDPIAFQEALDAHFRGKQEFEQKLGQIRQIQAQQQAIVARQEAERQAEMQQRLAEGHKTLLAKMPELKDPAKRAEFQTKMLDFGTKNGFDRAEMEMIDDPRIVAVLDKAMKWDALQKSPPKPTQTQTGQPNKPAAVAQPGKRPTDGEAKAQQREQLMQRVRQSGGSLDAVAAAIAQMDL